MGMITINAARAASIAKQPPTSVTRRQFALELLAQGIVTGDEAVALASRSEPPAMVAAFIGTLPELDQAVARIDMAADTYAIDSPLLVSLFKMLGMSDDDRAAFFVSASGR